MSDCSRSRLFSVVEGSSVLTNTLVRLISLAGGQGGLALSTLGARSFLTLDADRITRADDRGLRFFIDVEAEDVGPRIVAHDIEVVFATRDVC
jgi:hypothetical protein